MTSEVRPAPDRDEGSVLVLALGMIVVCLMAVAVVVDASTVFLARRSLQSAADAAALAGAQAIDVDAYYERGAADGIALSPAEVRASVIRHLRLADAPALVSVTVDADTVVVRVRDRVRPPFSGWLTPGGSYALEAEAGAALRYRPATP